MNTTGAFSASVDMLIVDLSKYCISNTITNCGMQAITPIDTSTRIVNGIQAIKNSWPWQVYLSMGCGGSIISNTVVIIKIYYL